MCASEQKSSAAAAAADRGCWPPLRRLLLLTGLAAFCLCLGFLEVHQLRQSAELQRQLVSLQRRVTSLEYATSIAAAAPVTAGTEPARDRRAVSTLRTVDGVPIVSRSYGARRRQHSQGLRIYETFQAESGGQPAAPRVNYETDDPSIQPHHRSSAVYRPSSRFGRVNTSPVIANEELYAAAAAAADDRAAAAAPSELHRRSRVRQTPRAGGGGSGGAASGRWGHVSALSRAGGHISQAAPVLEARGPPAAFVSPPAVAPGGVAGGHQGRNGRRRRCAVAHFHGHVTSARRNSTSYGGSKGNGRLRNTMSDGVFSDWKPADWIDRRRCRGEFHLNGGQVTVPQAGVYYLYAQITYLETEELNVFEIQVNSRSFIKCFANIEVLGEQAKTNTCFTAGVTYLNTNDTVSVRDLEQKRQAIMLSDRSFFGMLRVSG